jgi:energy-coupling factor transporter ATP-binding protein EcfA2
MTEDNWFLSKPVEKILLEGHRFLWRMIICQQYILNHEMEKKVMGCVSLPSFEKIGLNDTKPRILGFSTDSMKVFMCPPHFKAVLKSEAKPGDLVLEEGPAKIRGSYINDFAAPKMYEFKEITWTSITKEELLKTKSSAMILGQGGAGKTHLLKELHDAEPEKKQRILVYTNNSKNTLMRRKVDKVFTLAAQKLKDEDLEGIDVVMIDEFTMIEEKHLGMIYHAWLRNPQMTVRVFGDDRQCKPFRKKNQKWWDYTNEKIIWEMTGGIKLELPYLPESGRYNLATKNEIDYLQQNHKLSAGWKNMKEFEPDTNYCKYEFNIVPQAWHRDKVNHQLAVFHYTGKKIVETEKLSLWVGIPVISHDNVPKVGIINSNRYVITEIDKD